MASKKGIVLEKDADGIIVLFPDGKYEKINTSKYFEVGDYYEKPKRTAFRYAAAAVVILCLIAGMLDFFMVKAYAQVVPGVELGINRWNRVVEVEVDDKNDLFYMSDNNLKGKSSEDATRILVEELLARSKKLEKEISFTVKVENNPALQEKLVDEVKMVLERAAKKKRAGLAVRQQDTSFIIELSTDDPVKGNELKKGQDLNNGINKKVKPKNQSGKNAQVDNGSEGKSNKNDGSGKLQGDKSAPAYSNKFGDSILDDIDDIDDIDEVNNTNILNDDKYNIRDAGDLDDEIDNAKDKASNGWTVRDEIHSSISAGNDDKDTSSHGKKD